jgi:hypothetical protein
MVGPGLCPLTAPCIRQTDQPRTAGFLHRSQSALIGPYIVARLLHFARVAFKIVMTGTAGLSKVNVP